MVTTDRATTVFFWIICHFNSIVGDHDLDVNVTDAVIAMREESADLMSFISTDQPYPYIALVGGLVKLNILIMSTWKAIQWSIWLWSLGWEKFFEMPHIVMDICGLFVWNMSYQAMYDLGYILVNPFKGRRIDVSHEAIGDELLTLRYHLATMGGEVLPAELEKKLNSKSSKY
jgi:hypothetical protein